MKKYLLIGFALGVLGCVSTLTREPAGIDASRFSFQLYGSQRPQVPYQFQLLNLEDLKRNQVTFQSYQASDSRSSDDLRNWQKSFEQFAHENKKGIQFNFNKTLVSVDGDDLKNLKAVLNGIDATETDPALLVRKKAEAISSFNELFKAPIEASLELLTTPVLVMSRFATPTVAVKEGAPVKITPTSFWQPRTNQNTDMWYGAGHIDFLKLPETECVYRGAKTGYGVHAGFKITCDGKKLKLKFGREDYSGPFNSRIYHRLGFNVPAIHHVKSVKIKYDLRIFSEINERKAANVDVKLATKTVSQLHLSKNFDAMDFVRKAVLKDGTEIAADDFKKRLLKNCTPESCEYNSENVRSEFESQVDYLIFSRATVTECIGEEIGPWTYSDLDHPYRTEIKTLLLLGAWTGNFDLRKDNNSLVWVKETGELKHFISDPGAGFGNQSNPFFGGAPFKNMKWNMTMETAQVQDGAMEPLIQVNFRTLIDHPSFRNLSYQEAQWMARQIASISESEISEALAASGLSAAEFLLAREKLVSVQQDFIEKFGLKKEFSSRLRSINREINFDPTRDSVKVTLHNGAVIVLEGRGLYLKKGVLVSGPAGT